MEFDSQIRKFLQLTDMLQISSHAQCLYIQLLQKFRENIFPDTLKIDNMTIMQVTRLSRRQLIDARTELQGLSLIDYTSGSGSASGTYTMIDISKDKIKNIAQISYYNGSVIANLSDLKEKIKYLKGDFKTWGLYILNVIDKTIKQNVKGVFSNYYVSTQKFLQIKNELQYDTIFKLISQLKYRDDINNKESYILATLANSAY